MSEIMRILVLAGRRSSALDPLEQAAGVSHKCLAPVAGEAMIGRVLRTAAAAAPDARLYVSVEDFAAIADEPTVALLHEAGRLTPVPAQAHLVDSIIAGSAVAGFPLIVTTADNVLLTAEALRQVEREGLKRDADALVVLAERERVLEAHPDGQRRFYQFREGAYSNCNLFWLGSAAALRATESFRHGGQFAKHPGRIVKAFGLLNLLRFRFGLTTLGSVFDHVSRRFGVRIAPLLVSDGRLAIDVDNERTKRVVEEILARETIA